MRRITIGLIVLILTAVCVSDGYGQRRNKYGYMRSSSKKYSNYRGGKTNYGSARANAQYWTVGFSINSMNYFGDLSPASGRFSTDINTTKLGFGLTASKPVYPGIFVRFGYNYGSIEGDDFSAAAGDQEDSQGRYARNFQFKNTIHELSLSFEFNLLRSNNGTRGRFPINPYFMLGVAAFSHAPKGVAPAKDQAGKKLKEAGQWVDLRSLGTEGQNIDSLGVSPYGKISIAIPIGGGVKIKVSESLDLNVEIGFRKLFTDHIDDVSGAYVNLDYFGDNNLARAMSERGAETTYAPTGEDRNTDFYKQLPNTQGLYTVGENYASNGNVDRGGASDNDLYFITQIRLVYVIGKKRVSRGKFR